MYKNTKEIKEALVKDGWSQSIQLEEVSSLEIDKMFCGTLDTINHKFFRMLFCGNIFDDKGNVVLYDIPVINS